MNTKLENPTKYGKLIIISEPFRKLPQPNSKQIRTFVILKCECGNEITAQLYGVKKGQYTSCGCQKAFRIADFNTTHGLAKHPLFKVWSKMKERCYNKNWNRYKDWGGRGITVCVEWKDDFQTFYDWAMANGWQKGLQIDREKNDKNYTPENCRFVTPKINNRNKRSNKLTQIDADNIRKLVTLGTRQSDLARKYKVSFSVVSAIIKNRIWI